MNHSSMEEIAVKLKDIFKQRFEIDLEGYSEHILDMELLGYEINMQPRDLIYLLFDVETKFGIEIPQIEIAEGRFNTFNSITNIITNCLQSKEKQAV